MKEKMFIKRFNNRLMLSLKNHICLSIMSMISFTTVAQQDWRLSLNDDFFNKYMVNGLRVGDTLPDLALQELYEINNDPTGKARLSDFRNKLIIFDFWGTSCSSCIAMFPKMEQLQKKYGEKIQIILVNYGETLQQIRQRKPDLKMPDLISIVQKRSYSSMEDVMKNNQLYNLLPARAVPYHVWIGPDKVIKLQGGFYNTYEGKIEAFLRGETVTGLEGANTQPKYQQSFNPPSYYRLLGSFKETSISYGSYFTRHNKYIVSDGGGRMSLIDTATNTIRTTYVNRRPGTFYIDGVFRPSFMSKQQNQIVWAPPNYDLEISPGLDSLWFDEVLGGEGFRGIRTDTSYMKNSYCYEQILPMHTSSEEVRARKLDDFNRFFSVEIGMKAQSEKRTIPCYVLVEKSKVNLYSYDETMSQEEVLVKGKKMVEWKGFTIAAAIAMSIDKSPLKIALNNNRKAGRPWLLLSDTEWSHYSKKTKVILPHPDSLQTIEQLRQAIQPYGFDIIEATRELEFAVFSKISNK